MSAQAGQEAAPSRGFVARTRTALDALEHLVGGFGTAVGAAVAVVLLLATAVLCLAGVGLLVGPAALRTLRAVADRERVRLSRWGPEILGAEPVPNRLSEALRDAAVQRELGWAVLHAVAGLLLGMAAVILPLASLHDTSFLIWWKLVPEKMATPSLGLWTIRTWPTAVAVSLAGLAVAAALVVLLPGLARLQARPGRRLLSPPRGTDLALRVAELNASRAAALEAHATELRRIERSLHDGTQNRLVAVNVLLGAAKRALVRDPDAAMEVLERAQDANEQALAELRAVVRSIVPPVLAERSLPDALTALAAACPVICRIDADLTERYAVSVEATAYFVVAEALTNIAKHSGARNATVRLGQRDGRLRVDVVDDGQGGAEPRGGSGLSGILRRVEALDGTFALTSPVGGPTTMSVSLPCGS